MSNIKLSVNTLDRIPRGKTVTVSRIEGGWRIRQKLNQMGIHIGDQILIKRHGFMGGPTLIQIHGSEVAIGRGMAQKIIVNLNASQSS